MSATRKRYFARLVGRCLIFVLCVLLCLFRPGDFAVLDWDTLSKAYELKKYFIVYFTAPKTITVPKEAMDYDEMRQLTKLLQKKCGKNFINRA